MTRKQRIHFLWLIVCNANRIIQNCRSVEEGTRIITQATDKRAQLGLPCKANSHNTGQKLSEIRRILNRNTRQEQEFISDPF